jgi:hypothetical protein
MAKTPQGDLYVESSSLELNYASLKINFLYVTGTICLNHRYFTKTKTKPHNNLCGKPLSPKAYLFSPIKYPELSL